MRTLLHAVVLTVTMLIGGSGCGSLTGKTPERTKLPTDMQKSQDGWAAAKAYLDRKGYKYECQDESLFAMFDCRSGDNILACQFAEGEAGMVIVRARFRVEEFSQGTVRRLLKPAAKLKWERCRQIIAISIECSDGQLDRALSDILESLEVLMRRAHRRTGKQEGTSNSMRLVVMVQVPRREG